jgi:dephospho-CoA kinase
MSTGLVKFINIIMKAAEFINESINDKGLFKAVIFGGTPGAGKSYVLDQIASGQIGARIVNTDKMLEFLGKQQGIDLGDKDNQMALLDQSKNLTINQFANYVNGMLPLFVDGTSSNAPNTLRRVGILESFGYDVGFVWVETDLEVAMKRASQRDRKVDPEFIKSVHAISAENKEYFASKFSNFTTVKNNDGELTNQAVNKAFNQVSNFFTQPVENPIGRRKIAQLQETGDAYLVPSTISKTDLLNVLKGWYRKT